MPRAAARVCNAPGCGRRCFGPYCPEHEISSWERHHAGKDRHERGYGKAWQRIRRAILRRDNGLCQSCRRKGRIREAKTVDHIVPKAKGGTDEWANLEAICDPCHRAKTARESR